MLDGYICNVPKSKVQEINELRVKFALYVKLPNEKIIRYLAHNPLIKNFSEYFDKLYNQKSQMNLKELEDFYNNLNLTSKLEEMREVFPACEQEINKINLIYEAFNNALECQITEEYLKEIKSFLLYDYKSIENKLKCIQIDYSINDFSIFQKAFLYYKIGEYKNAYNELKKISYEAGKNKNYLIAVTSNAYQYHLGQFIENYFQYDEELFPDFHEVLDEYKKINIDELIKKHIHKDIKDVITSITNLSLFKEVFEDFYRSYEAVLQMYSNVKKNSWGFSNSLHGLYENLYDYVKFLFSNYFFPTEFAEITKVFDIFIKSMLYAYGVNIMNSKKQRGEFTYSGGMETFDILDFYIMIEYGSVKELREIIDICDIEKFNITDESVKNDLLKMLENITINNTSKNIYNISKKLEMLYFIFARIELNISDVENILKSTISIFKFDNKICFAEKYNFSMAKNKILSDFIANLHNSEYKKKNIFNPQQLEEILLILLVEIKELDYHQCNVADYHRIIRTLTAVLNINFPKYKLKNSDKIVDEITDFNDKQNIITTGCYVYKLLDKKTKLKQSILKYVKELDDFRFIIYSYDLLEAKIIKPTLPFQKKMLNLTQKALIYQVEHIKSYMGHDYLFCILSSISYLLSNNKWKLEAELKDTIIQLKEVYVTFENVRQKYWLDTYKLYVNILSLYIAPELINLNDLDLHFYENLNDQSICKLKNYFKDNSQIRENLILSIIQNLSNESCKKNLLEILF